MPARAASKLFELGDAAPNGWAYEPEFLSTIKEQLLLQIVQSLPLSAMRYKSYVSRRRGISFGSSYDFDNNRLLTAISIPAELDPLRKRAASWLGKYPSTFTQVLVAEYHQARHWGGIEMFPTLGTSSACHSLAMRLLRFEGIHRVRCEAIRWRAILDFALLHDRVTELQVRREGNGSTPFCPTTTSDKL